MADAKNTLTHAEKDRYSRHILLKEVGLVGQERLKQARVLIIGVGGLGTPAALYLAAAGVGTLGLVDFDRIERSNLQRQILFADRDVGRLKAEVAREKLLAFNPHLQLEIYPQRLDAELAQQLIPQFDVIVDGTDNFATRYLLNDVCVWHQKPCVHGSIYQFDGQVTVFQAPNGPCYRCLFPLPPPPEHAPNCAEAGVLGLLPGQIGLIQATETIKLLLQTGKTLVGRLLRFDALTMTFGEIGIPKDPDCPVCGQNPNIFEPLDYGAFCRGPERTPLPEVPEITPADFQIQADLMLVDIRQPQEWDICHIPGSQLKPMEEMAAWSKTLDPKVPLVITCRSGIRGAKAVAFLREQGFENVHNLKGGVLAWLEAFDDSQPRY